MKIAKFSRVGFILAAAGSAVGLGNIWKFPYITGEYGGGAFVMVYLITILFIGFSVLLAEMYIGAIGKKDTVGSFEALAPTHKNHWKYAGFMGLNGLIIMTFYSVVIGWIFHNIFSLLYYGLPSTVADAEHNFNTLLATGILLQIAWHSVATIIVLAVVYRGIKAGIERINLILMPALVTILLGMLAYAFSLDGFSESLKFMFSPDWGKIDSEAIIRASGHAFFTLSLGMGAIMTYSASLPKNVSLTQTALIVTFVDTFIAIIAGLMIFAFLFEFGEEPAKGPGLVFISMPVIFAQMGLLGSLLALLFFLSLAFAGLTSAVSLVEPTVQYLIDRFKHTRLKATLTSGLFYYIVGIGALLSYSEPYGEMFSIGGKPLFDIIEVTTDSVLLPVGGLLMAIFVGYVVQADRVATTVKKEMGSFVYAIWRFSIRYIAPLAVLFMMLNGLGIIEI